MGWVKRAIIFAGAFMAGEAIARPADCMLAVRGEILIDGPCDFSPIAPGPDIRKGSFQITAGDRFAIINIEPSGQSLGYYNEFPGSQKPSGRLGRMRPDGACWKNQEAEICAWKPGESRGDVVQSADRVIRCERKGAPEIVLSLGDHKAFGDMVSCISGDFVADLTPCAPDGGYGLSAPTGSAALVGVTKRWQELDGHSGGITNFFSTVDKLSFSGGWGAAWDWEFVADRLTGDARLTVKGGKALEYKCVAVKQKF
ncbi:hypothetical protein [Pseudochelatococcus contaminans]|uniref:Uncharacterized protein n=1 Tax=Pseudochelatococcus contaminans TaxID=1538103 RepID=A0A7W6EG58_9HYPH|nr:hypothetical protein [Pseudochelatococcus contaminans]MBB3808747.1 hypothetical protein [Pseudochelatococcus contaminans]